MDEIMLRNTFCMDCSLQFYKRLYMTFIYLWCTAQEKDKYQTKTNNCELTSEVNSVMFNENHSSDKPFVLLQFTKEIFQSNVKIKD